MNKSIYQLAIVAFVVFAAISGEAKAATTTTTEVCGMNLDDVMTCKVACVDEEAIPPEACCKALQSAKIPCLCLYKAYLPSFGIDPEMAMKLPGRCKLQNAKAFHC